MLCYCYVFIGTWYLGNNLHVLCIMMSNKSTSQYKIHPEKKHIYIYLHRMKTKTHLHVLYIDKHLSKKNKQLLHHHIKFKENYNKKKFVHYHCTFGAALLLIFRFYKTITDNDTLVKFWFHLVILSQNRFKVEKIFHLCEDCNLETVLWLNQ